MSLFADVGRSRGVLAHRYRRTNPQNSSKIIQRAVESKARAYLAANIHNAESTGLGRPSETQSFSHLKHRRKKAAYMQDEWNRVVTENVRLLRRTRDIALRDELPPVRTQMTHKSLNEPFLQKCVLYIFACWCVAHWLVGLAGDCWLPGGAWSIAW